MARPAARRCRRRAVRRRRDPAAGGVAAGGARARDRPRPRGGPSPRGRRRARARWSPPSRCASGCKRSGCWRCIAPAGRPTRSPRTARRGRPGGGDRRRAGPELRRLHEAILRQDPSLELPAAPSSCRRSSTRARRWWDATRTWSGCASAGAGARRCRPAGAGDGCARDRQDPAGGRAGGRGASRPGHGAVRLGRGRARRGARGDLAARERRRGRRCWCSTMSTVRATRCSRRSTSSPALARCRCWCCGDRGRRRSRAHSTRRCASRRSTALRSSRWHSSTWHARRGRRPLERLLEESGGIPQGCTAWPPSGRAPRRRGASTPPRIAPRPSARPAYGRGRAGRRRGELQALRERAEPRTTPAVVVCPFKGLASFDVEDAEFFFGRSGSWPRWWRGWPARR